MAFLVLLLPLVCLDLLGDDLGRSRHRTLGTRSGGFPRCPRCPHRDGVPSVTSSLMSVSTAVFSASLRQMPSRGLSLLVAAAGGLSVEHSPGLPCGESPPGCRGDLLFTLLGVSPPFQQPLNLPARTHGQLRALRPRHPAQPTWVFGALSAGSWDVGHAWVPWGSASLGDPFQKEKSSAP